MTTFQPLGFVSRRRSPENGDVSTHLTSQQHNGRFRVRTSIYHAALVRTCCTHIARCRLGQLLYHRTFAVLCVDLGTPMMYARRQIS